MTDHWTNLTNATSSDMPALTPDVLDYCEIILLSVMVLIGGPMNIVFFLQTLGLYSKVCPLKRKQLAMSTRSKSNSRHSRRLRKRNTTPSRSRLLKLHLIAANLFIILIYGISQISWLATYSWRGGDLMCRLIKFFDTFCFYATSNIVVLIALERVSVALFIDQPRMMSVYKKRLRYVACIPWILAMICSLPQLYIWHVFTPYPSHLPDWQQCITIWMGWKVNLDPTTKNYAAIAFQEALYSGLHLVLVFWFPALIVVVSYAIILIRFHQHIKNSTRQARRAQYAVNAEQFLKRAVDYHNTTTMATTPVCSSCINQDYDLSSVTPIENTTPLQSRKPLLPYEDEPKSAGLLTEVPTVINSSRILTVKPNVTSVAVQTLSKAKKRTVRATAWILFAYIACWAPYNALELWRYLDAAVENRYLELLSNLIVLNAVLNPLVYKM